MTPPMTDAELLAYIERTPELRAALIAARLYANELFEEPYIPPDTRRIARAFHAHEQRVREEAAALLRDVKQDLEDRAEDGVVELSSNVWQRLCDYLAKQGGK